MLLDVVKIHILKYSNRLHVRSFGVVLGSSWEGNGGFHTSTGKRQVTREEIS